MEDEAKNDAPLWGEMEEDKTTLSSNWSKDILNNLEQDVIISSVQSVSFKNNFYCNGASDHSTPYNTNITINDPMRRTVKLIKYRNDLKDIAESGNIQKDGCNIVGSFTQFSEAATSSANLQSKNKKIILFKDQPSAFTSGIYNKPPVNLTEDSTLDVLRSCVCVILAFTGFSETTIVPLQLLTEVTEDYIKKMVNLLHVNVEKESLEGETGFSDVLDRTCHEMGIGTIRNLVNYYKGMLQSNSKKVTEYKKEIRAYEEVVKKLRDEKRQFSELSSIELDDDNLVIPELHVTSINSSEMASEPFEAGLQMLQTLERQQLKNSNCSETSTNGSSLNSSNLKYSSNDFENVAPLKKKRK